MMRQVVLGGLAGDPERPLTWGYKFEGAAVGRTQRERSPVQTTTIARDPVPLAALPEPVVI
jgi:hypothetical protein